MSDDGDARAEDEIDIWSRLDASVLMVPVPPTRTPKESKTDGKKRAGKLKWALPNATAALAWAWVIIKLFIADVDRWIVARIAPGYEWLVDFRVFAVLAVASILVLAVRKHWGVIAFVVFWPFIVVGFYIPRFLYRRRSVVMTVGLVHAMMGFARGVRFTIVAATIFAFSVLVIWVSENAIILSIASAALLGLWLVLLVRTIRFAVSPGRFVEGQHRLVRRILRSDFVWRITRIPEPLKNPDIVRYDKEQANSLLTSMSIGLGATRGAQLWTESLDKYRRSPATLLVGALAVLGLFVFGVTTFALVNAALYAIDGDQFSFPRDEPRWHTFVYYTFSAAAFSEISALHPAGPAATMLNVVTGLFTGIIVLVLVFSLVLGNRQSGEDPQTESAMEAMRREADELEERLSKEYGLGREALWARLNELGGGLLRLVPFLFTPTSGRGRHRSDEPGP